MRAEAAAVWHQLRHCGCAHRCRPASVHTGTCSNAESPLSCCAAGRAGTKENRAPPAAAAPVALLAGCAISVGAGLLRHLHSRSCDLARQLTQTRSELHSKASQLSEVMEELQCTRCAWGRSCAAAAAPALAHSWLRGRC